MLAAYSGNRQISLQIRAGSSIPVQNGVASVIVYAPGLNFAPCILEGHEPVFVQALLSQSAVERLHGGIVRWGSWP